MSYEIRLAEPHERVAAYRLVAGTSQTAIEDDVLAQNREFIVATRDAHVCGAAAVERRAPGLRSIVLPSACQAARNLRESLLRGAARSVGVDDCVLMLEVDDIVGAQLAGELGFRRSAEVSFMEWLKDDAEVQADASSLEFVEGTWQQLTHVVEETLRDSLDCPDLQESIGAAQMLEGFATRASHRGRYWRLVRDRNALTGCLLINKAVDEGQGELVYMGVTPAARGRGLGGQIVLEAIRWARVQSLSRVVLAVDVANLPAARIYRRLGFTAYGCRILWFRTATS